MIDRRAAVPRAIALLLLLASSTATAQRLPQSYIVLLRSGLSAKEVSGLSGMLASRASAAVSMRPVFAVGSARSSLMSAGRLDRYMVVTADSGAANLAQLLAGEPRVEEWFPNRTYHVDREFNDSLIGGQWALKKVEAPGAWDVTIGDTSVLVGIVDTGIDFLHPDLVGALAVNAKEDLNGNGRLDPWSSGEVREKVRGDLDGIDQDGNGFVDDVVGFDFVDQVVPNLGDWRGRDGVPDDEFGHGTQVAGIIAATPNNRIGITGLAPGVRVVALRAFDASGNGEDDDVSAAIVYAADRGVRVLNMSFGDLYYSPLMRDAIAYAASRGVVMVASSGNNGAPDVHFPSSYREVMAVGATDDADRRTTFSSYGSQLSMVAPGSGILTTAPGGVYEPFGGTSASAPHVTAAAALVVSVHPDWTADEVRTTLELAADDLGKRGWDIFFGSGRLNVRRAVESAGAAAIAILSPEIDDGYSRDTTVTVRGSASAVFLKSWELELGIGEDPESWRSLSGPQSEGRLLDTLGRFTTADLPEGIVTLRLRLAETNGRQAERRVRLFIDRSRPRLAPEGSLAIRNVWRFDERAVAITLRTDDLTRAVVWLRKKGAVPEPFRAIELEPERTGQMRNHLLLLTGAEMEGDVPYEAYIRLTNLAGDTTLVGSPASPIELTRERRGFPFNTFLAKSYSLPIGFSDGSTTTLLGETRKSIALNRYRSGSFDKLLLYSFDGGKFVPRDSSGSWVPRGFGDCDGNGRRELLGQLRGASVVFEQAGSGASPFSSVKFIDTASGDFFASGYYDFDRDGRDEVIARTDPGADRAGYYFVSAWDGSTLRRIAQLPNPTPPGADEAQNQFGSSESAVGDFDGDGNPEILYGDNDADFVVYERQPSGEFTLRWTDVNDGVEGSRMVAAGDVDGDGIDEVIVGYHSRTLQNPDREYDAPLWTIKVFKLDAAGNGTLLWSTQISFLRPTEIFRAGIAAGDLDGVPGAELAISVFPNLYLFRWDAATRTMAPLWWLGGSISNRPIIADFDGDGLAEVGTGDGAKIRFYQFDSAAVDPASPSGVHAWATSDSSAHLEWAAVPGATRYTVYRGIRASGDSLVDFVPVIDTDRLAIEDDGIETVDGRLDAGTDYIYFVTATVPASGGNESLPSEFVTVFTHNPARIVAVVPAGGRGLRLRFDVDLSTELHRPGSFAVRSPEGEMVEISSVTSDGDRSVVVHLAEDRSGDSLLIRPTRLFRDAFGSPADTTAVAGVRMPAAEPAGERFIATHAFPQGGDTIVVDFNREVDESTGLDPANYTLDPAGDLRTIVFAPGRRDRVLLVVGEGYPLGPYGHDYTITIRDVRDGGGRPLNDGAGSVVGFTFAANDLENLFVYPHPFSLTRDQVVTFAGLTRKATITIFTQSGIEVGSVAASEGNGGAVWNGRDLTGRALPSGIYLYQAAGIDDDGRAITSSLHKLAIVP